MQTTLHQDSGAAECDCLIDLLTNLFKRSDVCVGRTRSPIKRAEGADDVANVCVVHISIDDVGNYIPGVPVRPYYIRGGAHRGEIM